jgi:hypothetical protein
LACIGYQKNAAKRKVHGDALLQTITVDFFTHKRVKNEGRVLQFFVENCHPAIISKETFQAAQREMERRSQYTNKYPFFGKIVCGACGKKFTRKHLGHGKIQEADLNMPDSNGGWQKKAAAC